MRKKVVSTLVVAITIMSMFTGCSGRTEEPAENPSGEISSQAEEDTQENIREEAGGSSAGISGTENTSGAPAVYMTTDISSQGLIAVYEALQASPEGNIAVKLSTGEPGSNYLRADLIGDLVQSFEDPTIVECNTAYGGSRSQYSHALSGGRRPRLYGDRRCGYHGRGRLHDSCRLPEATNLEENYVGSHFANYDYYVVLSHFKGQFHGGIRRCYKKYLYWYRFCGRQVPYP